MPHVSRAIIRWQIFPKSPDVLDKYQTASPTKYTYITAQEADCRGMSLNNSCEADALSCYYINSLNRTDAVHLLDYQVFPFNQTYIFPQKQNPLNFPSHKMHNFPPQNTIYDSAAQALLACLCQISCMLIIPLQNKLGCGFYES